MDWPDHWADVPDESDGKASLYIRQLPDGNYEIKIRFLGCGFVVGSGETLDEAYQNATFGERWDKYCKGDQI